MKSNLYISSALNTPGQSGVFASAPLKEGDVVLCLTGTIIDSPSRSSIQIGEGLHIEDEIGAFINHSSLPSCIIRGADVIATKDIEVDEEITFDYSKSEDTLACPFVCSDTGNYISGKKGVK
jgi:hypothetical protein